MLTVLRQTADYSLISGIILSEKGGLVNHNLPKSGCFGTACPE